MTIKNLSTKMCARTKKLTIDKLIDSSHTRHSAEPAASNHVPIAVQTTMAPTVVLSAEQVKNIADDLTNVGAKAQRKPSAYNKFMRMFCADESVKEKYPNHKERFAAAASTWKSLSEEERKDAIAKAEKFAEEHPKEAKPAKRASKKGDSKKAASDEEEKEKKKRAPTMYNKYMSKRVKELQAELPDLTYRERFSMAATSWKELTPEEKEQVIAELKAAEN
jgi:autonomous glycyl radical cofactor GrcA